MRVSCGLRSLSGCRSLLSLDLDGRNADRAEVSPMARTKMVRLREDEWKLLMKAKEELRRRGYAGLEDLEEELDEETDDENTDARKDMGAFLGGLALGAIAALGAAAIIKKLSDRNK